MKLLAVILCLIFLDGPTGQVRHTWPPWVEPCEDGLPFDGSIVPDCRLYVDPDKPEPHFLEHSTSKGKILESCATPNWSNVSVGQKESRSQAELLKVV